MPITALDHMVMYVTDIDAAIDFYTAIDGIEEGEYAGVRRYLDVGEQRINLRHVDDTELVANTPAAGSADICLISDTPLPEIQSSLESRGIEIIEGPVPRSGAHGDLSSIYFRDPDGNLVEIANLV